MLTAGGDGRGHMNGGSGGRYKVVSWSFGVALLSLVAVTALAYYALWLGRSTDDDVARTHETRTTLAQLRQAVIDAETAQRGFLLTGRDEYLQPFDPAIQRITESLARAGGLISNEAQRQRLAVFTAGWHKLEAELRATISLKRQQRDAQAAEIVLSDRGKQEMDGLRELLNTMDAYAQTQLKLREQRNRSVSNFALIFIGLGSLLAFTMSIGAYAALRRELVQRQAAQRVADSLNLELQRSNRELQDFAYVASHDLQEPLRKIQAFGDRLVSKYGTALGPEGGDYLLRMQSSASRMRRLINDLLEYSRVTTKGRPFDNISLTQVAADVVSDLETGVQDAGAALEIGALPEVRGDMLQVRQLFQNLIGNAIKFRRADAPPQVRVSAERDGEHVVLSFADNGIGFDEKYLDRIFTPFQRLHARSQYEGTGMGLAICRRVVERHGGSITAHSTPGIGSTFVVRLPVNPEQEETT